MYFCFTLFMQVKKCKMYMHINKLPCAAYYRGLLITHRQGQNYYQADCKPRQNGSSKNYYVVECLHLQIPQVKSVSLKDDGTCILKIGWSKMEDSFPYFIPGEALKILPDVSSQKRKNFTVSCLIIHDKNHSNLVDASQWLVVTLRHLVTVISQQHSPQVTSMALWWLLVCIYIRSDFSFVCCCSFCCTKYAHFTPRTGLHANASCAVAALCMLLCSGLTEVLNRVKLSMSERTVNIGFRWHWWWICVIS